MALNTIQGQVMLDKKTMIGLLSALEPKNLDRDSNLYDIGYERAKADIMQKLGLALGRDFATPMSVKMVRELRNDKSS